MHDFQVAVSRCFTDVIGHIRANGACVVVAKVTHDVRLAIVARFEESVNNVSSATVNEQHRNREMTRPAGVPQRAVETSRAARNHRAHEYKMRTVTRAHKALVQRVDRFGAHAALKVATLCALNPPSAARPQEAQRHIGEHRRKVLFQTPLRRFGHFFLKKKICESVCENTKKKKNRIVFFFITSCTTWSWPF
jgi:hypothetical protein